MESTIRDWANAFSGYAFPSEDLVSIGIPVLKIGNVQRKCVTKEVDSYYNGELSQKLERYILQKNDFLIAMTGAGSVGRVGKMFECKGIFLVNQRIAIVRPKNEDDGFLYYWMSMPFVEKYLYSLGIGAGQPNISANDILNVKLNAPTLNVQRKIASILSSYDNLIENNNKRIRLLEQMAENLYKEWFVRFRFPGHENAEFENGLPKGWKIKRYCDVLSIKYGKGLETTKILNTGYPVFGSNGQIGYYSTYMYEMPQILISCRGASSGIVNISLPYSFVTNNSLVCEIKNLDENAFEYFKYYFLNTNLIQYQTGSAQPQITIANIEKLKLIIPPTEIQTDFAVIIRQIDSQILNTQLQSNLLSRQRDLLLPRLMSGKLEVNV